MKRKTEDKRSLVLTDEQVGSILVAIARGIALESGEDLIAQVRRTLGAVLEDLYRRRGDIVSLGFSPEDKKVFGPLDFNIAVTEAMLAALHQWGERKSVRQLRAFKLSPSQVNCLLAECFGFSGEEGEALRWLKKDMTEQLDSHHLSIAYAMQMVEEGEADPSVLLPLGFISLVTRAFINALSTLIDGTLAPEKE